VPVCPCLRPSWLRVVVVVAAAVGRNGCLFGAGSAPLGDVAEGNDADRRRVEVL